MQYITVLNDIEEVITKDEQMYHCIENGGKIYSIDDDGNRKLVADENGFLMGRPGFAVHPKNLLQEGE